MTEEQKALAEDLAQWRNYAQEALDGDYSVETILTAWEGTFRATEALEAAGVDSDYAVIWDEDERQWVVSSSDFYTP